MLGALDRFEMNKDAIFTSNGISSDNNTSTRKLQISPMSPLNIQTLKNGFIESSQQNGHLLLQSKQPLPHQHHVMTAGYRQTASNPLIYSSNTIVNSNGQQQSANFDNKMLHKIIAKDVNHPRNSLLTEKSVDSRSTVVKKAAGGTVQITYKNMINISSSSNNQHNMNNNSNPVFILPKPVNGLQQSSVISTAAPFDNHNDTIHFTGAPPNGIQSSNYLITSNISSPQVTKSLNELNTGTISTWLPDSHHQVPQHQIPTADITNGMPAHSVGTQSQPIESFPHSTPLNTLVGLHDDQISDLNPFNGLDIDLSCLDTEPFDALQLQHFYQHGQDVLVGNGTKPNDFDSSSSIPDSYTNTNGNCETAMVIDSSTNIFNELYYKQPQQQQPPNASSSSNNGLKNIIDVSPEMAASSGGIKIILIGSWNAKDARYQCKFDNFLVDAQLIQNGVLRCYSPKHKPGTVKLSIFSNNLVISEQVDFTFVESSEKTWPDRIDHDEWLSISNKSLIHLLVERISFIADMVAGEEQHAARSVNMESDANCIEEKLIEICKSLMSISVDIEFEYKIERTMTVLHLSSALGYIKLIQLLMNWVESNPNKIIQAEASPTSADQFTLIPVMWSSAKGHFNTTCVLHQWAESTIEQKDACGCTALSLATENGHESLVEYLGRLLKKSTISRENSMNQEQLTSSSSTTSTTLSSSYQNPASCVSTISKDGVDDSSPRTLGKTLAFIQSMLNDQDDEGHNSEDEDESSLFGTPEFVSTRQRSITDESVASSSQLSPASPAQTALQSPFNRQMRETAEFCEFFYKAKKIEKDFAELTLTDAEQEELYHAANVIQTAYKAYKERRKQRDQEFSSATLIQSYYRRYKQYASFKKMQKGAVLIQNQYRAHREKAKKKTQAASLIQTYYRRYRQRKYGLSEHNSVQEKNKLEQQAGRRINRYLKQTTKRFSREFPEEFNAPPSNMDSQTFPDSR